MKAFTRTDRGRVLKQMYDTWVQLGKFDLARQTMEVMTRESKAYYAVHKK